MKNNIWVLIASVFVLLSSCRKKDDPVTPPPASQVGNVEFKFAHVVGNQPLVLNNVNYINEHGDTFSVKTFNYYISNIQLVTTSGATYTEPYSYHLVRSDVDSSLSFTLPNVPNGNYKSVTFMIGVDSLHNVSGAQTGSLDPGNGMLWSWKTGYIMAKFEGTFFQAGNQVPLAYHISGYTQRDNVLKMITLQFPVTANVSSGHAPTVHFRSDLSEWFKTPVTIDFSTLSDIANTGKQAVTIANNYSDMITLDSVKN